MDRQRLALLLTLAFAAAALVLLGAGLRQLELQPGRALTVPEMDEPRPLPLPVVPVRPIDPGPVPPGVASIIIIVLALSFLMFILSDEFRRQVLKRLRWLLGLVTVLLLFMYGMGRERLQELILNDGPRLGADGLLTAPFTAAPSFWLSFWLTFALVLGGAALGWWYWQRMQAASSLADRVGRQAEQALRKLEAGQGYQNAVIECYAEMVRLVSEHQGYQHRAAQTAREVEDRLRALGLPADAVHDLTRLFEETRYGSQEPGETQRERALRCLGSIARAASGEKAEAQEGQG